ncbi:unnamed protein product [Clonostachys byssicola]|uniref:Zn(2)-C6 fungal-type domain-containing protein n=1 Tax=Clonostachys byssicola TaxID=160290 RepID=A0A9N9Y6W2_9HYPO|nr:unnamed protein product [Clonostachys byssicola]
MVMQRALAPRVSLEARERRTKPSFRGRQYREYRDRKVRPCDFCRSKKAACHMEHGPPCKLCEKKHRVCTFVDVTWKERNADPALANVSGLHLPVVGAESIEGSPAQSRIQGENSNSLSHRQDGQSRAEIPSEPGLYRCEKSRVGRLLSGGDSVAMLSPSRIEAIPTPVSHADDILPDHSSFSTQGSQLLQGDGLPPPVCSVIENDFTASSEPRLDGQVLENARKNLESMINSILGHRFTTLYTHFVHPNFPIISGNQFPSDPSEHEVNSMPLSLLAATFAAAVPFSIYDDVLSTRLPYLPSQTDLFRLAWTLVLDELHAPRLATIQTCLLLLQQHTTNKYVSGTPSTPTLMSTVVTLCHCLGLHRDSSQCSALPAWERQARKRIWWATWMMEKWTTFGESLPSMIRHDDSDVESLTRVDMDDMVSRSLDSPQHPSHFLYLVSLTELLSDIVETFFTVRSSARTAKNLEASLGSGKELQTRLESWRDSLPADIKSQASTLVEAERFEGPLWPGHLLCILNARGSFYLAFLTVEITLYRALLRPVANLAETAVNFSRAEEDGAKTVILGAMACVKEAVEFVESLRDIDWDAFWHSWSRNNFSIVVVVMLNLLQLLRPRTAEPRTMDPQPDSGILSVSSPQLQDRDPQPPSVKHFLGLRQEHRVLLDYATRWRWALKVASSGAGGQKGLMNLSLLRLDAGLSELGTAEPVQDDKDGHLEAACPPTGN